MDLYLIRHADAAPLGEGGVTEDANRPLTPKGEEQAKKLAQSLVRNGHRPAILVTSPLLRARQTAEKILEHLSEAGAQVRICDDLAPGGKRRRVAKYLRDLAAEHVALIGHEPDMGHLAGWLIGSKKAQIDLAKAGVGCIRVTQEPDKDEGVLLWLITPEWMA